MWSTDGNVYVSDESMKPVFTDGKVIGTILGNVDGITLGIDVGTQPSSLDILFDYYNDGKLEVLQFQDSLRSTHGKVLGFVEGRQL